MDSFCQHGLCMLDCEVNILSYKLRIFKPFRHPVWKLNYKSKQKQVQNRQVLWKFRKTFVTTVKIIALIYIKMCLLNRQQKKDKNTHYIFHILFSFTLLSRLKSDKLKHSYCSVPFWVNSTTTDSHVESFILMVSQTSWMFMMHI